MMLLAFALALSPFAPISRPIQIALIEALSDCRIELPRIGRENRNNVLAIGPSVRVGRARPVGGAACSSGASED